MVPARMLRASSSQRVAMRLKSCKRKNNAGFILEDQPLPSVPVIDRPLPHHVAQLVLPDCGERSSGRWQVLRSCRCTILRPVRRLVARSARRSSARGFARAARVAYEAARRQEQLTPTFPLERPHRDKRGIGRRDWFRALVVTRIAATFHRRASCYLCFRASR